MKIAISWGATSKWTRPHCIRHLHKKKCLWMSHYSWMLTSHEFLDTTKTPACSLQTLASSNRKIQLPKQITSFNYSYFDGLEYSIPLSEVTLDEALDDISMWPGSPLLLLFDGFLWGLLDAGLCASSASFLIRFITVGRNLVDKDISPGSWKHATKI